VQEAVVAAEEVEAAMEEVREVSKMLQQAEHLHREENQAVVEAVAVHADVQHLLLAVQEKNQVVQLKKAANNKK
jgi:hypothetical protein